MSNFFSIVITTFNRKALLLKCLESINAQEYELSDVEVCIVDDGSVDGTPLITEEHRYPFRCTIVSIQNNGPSNARNVGANNVSGKFIVFLEDDVIVHVDWLKNAYELLRSDMYDVLEGRTIYQNTKESVRRYDNEEYISFIPCNLFIRSEIFREIGGYDTEFNSVKDHLYFRDDTELGFRLMDKKVKFLKSAAVIAEHPEQFTDFSRCLRHALRYQFDPLLYKKHPAKFRTSIDVKRMFGVTLHRPHHYAYLSYLVFSILLGLSLLNILDVDSLILTIPLILLAFAFRYKYQGRDAVKLYKVADTMGFFILPYVYAYALLKGCFRYRSFGALV